MTRLPRAVAAVLLALVVEMSVAEFLAVQELGARRRRELFAIPGTCRPAITATKAVRGRVHVLVTCPDPGADGRRPDPPDPSGPPATPR